MRETRAPPEPRRRVWLVGVAPAPATDVAGLGPPSATASGPVGPVDWVHPVNVLTGQAQPLTCGPRRKIKKKEEKKNVFINKNN